MNTSLYRLNGLFALILTLALVACGSGDKGAPDASKVDWSQYVSMHTADFIPRDSHIRIRFTNDVITADKVGADASDVLEFEPAIKGSITYADAREIVVVPAVPLPSGQQYKATVDTGKLNGFTGVDEDFMFSFQVIRQDFEVEVVGLETRPGNDKEMSLSGKLTTADKADTAAIEKLLLADYVGQKMAIEWSHNADGLHHEFSIKKIARGKDNQNLKLSWDGKAIGVANTGSQDIEVPALGTFKVSKVSAVQGERQYIQVQFTDNINSRQNLRGLVRLSIRNFTTRVEGNILKIYPDSNVTGAVDLTLTAGIKNEKGNPLGKDFSQQISFASIKPQVRFVGKGVILPGNETLSIPFEAMNVDSVQVTAFQVFEDNMGFFLQANKLDGKDDMQRVGRYLWKKDIKLPSPKADEWSRYSIDVSELMKSHPGALFRFTLTIDRSNATYACTESDNQVPVPASQMPQNTEDHRVVETSSWDYAEDYYYGGGNNNWWRERENPCKDYYYQYSDNTKASRNFMASNIGIIAKADDSGTVRVVTTDILSSAPLSGVEVSIHNYQNQVIGTSKTDGSGFATIKVDGTPFYLSAQNGSEQGYLKLNRGTALPTSHFDVSGEKVRDGIKGFIYGERGVWRPGDDIYLTFVYDDKNHRLPYSHPVTLRLFSPKGQLVDTVTNTQPVGNFYAFKLKTAEDAPTGNWTVKAQLGGNEFSKVIKVETVIPNRLKVEMDFGKEILKQADMPLRGKIHSEWLHGAKAANLKVDVAVSFSPMPTSFKRFTDFIFDDPVREFNGKRETIVEQRLDGEGNTEFSVDLDVGDSAPGMLRANFMTRVFEESGAFSIDQYSIPYSPYKRYVGIQLPKGDAARGMLLTDTEHKVQVATVDASGNPVAVSGMEVTVYKIHWKWWWDKSGDSLARYSSRSHNTVVKEGRVSTDAQGRGEWEFEVKYPDWGRYLVRICDKDGGHCTGKVVYIDWPGWAGRAQEDSGAGANALTIYSDKSSYTVGETAKVFLPEAAQGRALVSIESGSRVLQQHWQEVGKGTTTISLPITADMAPNVYVNVTLLQPHEGKTNDAPIRLYGVTPIMVEDPATKLAPQLKTADEWEPESEVSIQVSEQNGKAMQYTLAIVDEGLLGLTRFTTPDLHGVFYRKEALGVTSWDMFDDVAGAYGGELERLLAIGGGDGGEEKDENRQKRRFPPVVKFIGPFNLEKGKTATHKIKLPQYVGAVRVMLVAGSDGAYGRADKSVFVRKPLNMLVTLPRVVGPDEEVTVPVSLFVMDPSIKQVELKLDADSHFEILGNNTQTVAFNGPGDQLAYVRLRVKGGLGKGKLAFTASSGKFKSESTVYIDVRSANPPTTVVTSKILKPGESWEEQVTPHGMANSNSVTLEVSAVPPINLEQRLTYLLMYPHGCIEQTTSSVFPQLYLDKMVNMTDEEKQRAENNVKAGIDRLKSFQVSGGGFAYWPGNNQADDWGSNYAGHFLLEAKRLGYQVPAEMLANWKSYQKSRASAWLRDSRHSGQLIQSYRLYTLALANEADVGAMNRMRETPNLSNVARWQLAAAYHLAGMPDAAKDVLSGANISVEEYLNDSLTYGSTVRDQAIILDALLTMEREDKKVEQLTMSISKALSDKRWHSTQTVAYSLLAMSHLVGADSKGDNFGFSHQVGSGKEDKVTSKAPYYRHTLAGFPDQGTPVKITNTSKKPLFVNVLVTGTAAAGEEQESSNGLSITASYRDTDGKPLSVNEITQGSDIAVVITVRNNTQQQLDNIALSHIVPSGWEIHNPRFSDGGNRNDTSDYQDLRDDRVYTYFSLRPGEEKRFTVLINAAYLGRFYLPAISVEAMYDASIQARTRGQWIEVRRGSRP